MSEHGDEPRIEYPRNPEKSSVKLVLNAKGDMQIELRVVAGETSVEMERIREIALDNYRQLIVAKR